MQIDLFDVLYEDFRFKNRLKQLLCLAVSVFQEMGMQDYQIKKQNQVSSNAQMYKQHGNGIIAQVMGFIIGMMWYEDENQLINTVFKNSFDLKKEREND